MHAAFLIVLIIGDPRAEWVDGLRRALSGALDPRVRVEISAQSNARELQASLDRLGGDATLTLAAVEFPHSPAHARLRLRASHSSQWFTRELSFQPADEETERGRALGFLLSSMVPELRAPPAPAPPAPAPKPSPAPPAVPAEAADGGVPVLPAPPVAIAAVEPPSAVAPPPVAEPQPPAAAVAESTGTVEPPRPPAAQRRGSVELGGLGTWGAGRASPDGGALLAGQLRFWRFALRLGATFTRGEVSAARAAATTTGPFVGGAFFIVDGRLQLSARVDVAADWFALATDDAVQSRWQLTFRPRLDLGVTISGPFAGFAALGADAWVGATRVHVNAHEVADLSPMAGAAEVGLRVSF